MSRHIYNAEDSVKKCTYTPPQNQDVNVYLTQLDVMLKSFKTAGTKDLTASKLDTLQKLLDAVILKIPNTP